jgi:predicted dehydrogenase
MTTGTARIRFAVVGCGVIGHTHARAITALAPAAELVLAVDTDPRRATALAAEHGAAHATTLAGALSRADIDAIAVCTPSGTHADVAVAALDAGKNVMIEKPVEVSVQRAARIAEAERRAGRTVSVISQHRFDAASELVYRAIQDGQFGTITSGVASVAWWRSQRYYDSGAWRGTWALDGGGALINQSLHTIDLLVWMLGDPVEVFAWSGLLAHRGIEVEDTAVATIRFAGGALAVVHGATTAYPGISARLQVHGDRGSAVIENDRLAYYHAATTPGSADYGTVGEGNQAGQILPPQAPAHAATADPGSLSDTAHIAQYHDFLDAVTNRRAPRVTVTDATKTLALILAIYRSARTGAPVNPASTEPGMQSNA